MAVLIDAKYQENLDLSAVDDVLCSMQWKLRFVTPTRAIAESCNCIKIVKIKYTIYYYITRFARNIKLNNNVWSQLL